MQKVLRSLLAVGGLATLAACGDDVSITQPADVVEISGAPVTSIKVGDVVQLSANVAVTWSTSSQAVASVDPNSGLVTAVSAGIASITATSTADQTKKASVTITVSGSVAPSVSIASVNAFATGLPVNPNAVAGQVNVVVNMDPGDFTVQSLELLLDGNVIDQQDFTAAAVDGEAAVDETASAVQQVTFALNTADFNATNGAAAYPNGSHALSARVVVTGGGTAGSAAPTKTLVFNNLPGLVFTITNDNGTDPATAINPSSGLSWIGGSVTLDVVGVSYSGQAFTSVTVNLFGVSRVIDLDNGVGSEFYDEDDDWDGTRARVGGYLSPGVENLTVTNSVLDGVAGPSGASAILNGTNAIPAIPAIRLDNVAPGDAPENGGAQPAISFATLGPWVTKTTSLLPTSSNASTIGIPSLNTLNGTDLGVSGVTPQVWVPGDGASPAAPVIGGTLPTASSCDLDGLVMVDTGEDLPESTASSAFPARIVFKDGVGNMACMDLPSPFGADFTAPTATIDQGPDDLSGWNAAPPLFAVTASDNAAGFTASPLRVQLRRVNEDGSTDCVIGSGGSCSASSQPLTFDPLGGDTDNGYYTATISIRDQAGNSVSLDTRTYAYDTAIPGFAGGVSLPSQINGATTNTFQVTVNDNLDLATVYGDVQYPGVGAIFRYPAQSIGAFGTPLEQGDVTVNYAVSDWMRCINPFGDFVSTGTQPLLITVGVTDHATSPATNPATQDSPAFGAAAQACNGVGNTQPGELNSFTAMAPDYGQGNVDVDLDGDNVGNTSSTTVTLKSVADVALNSSVNPFTRVDYFAAIGGVWVKIGSATATLAQTQTNRTYTYTFVWNPPEGTPTGNLSVVAIGVDSQGDAVSDDGHIVVIVP